MDRKSQIMVSSVACNRDDLADAGVQARLTVSNSIEMILHEFVLPQLGEDVLQRRQDRTKHMVNATLQRAEKADINVLSELLADGREEAVQSELVRLMHSGQSAVSVYLETLSGCARRLGDMWCEDTASFGDVTLAMVSLHRIMRGFRHELEAEIGQSDRPGSILLTTLPGETHIFALGVVEAFFRAAGWQVTSGLDFTKTELSMSVAERHFDLVGISISGASALNSCRDLVDELRIDSKNPDVKILVGGPPFMENPKLVALVGADGFAMDAKQALDVAGTICEK